MDVYQIKRVFVVFLTMAEVARIPIWLKDFVSYKTGEWKYRKLSSFFIHLSVI